MNDSVQKSRALIIYELLLHRRKLSRAEEEKFYQARTGYEGELYFSRLVQEKVMADHIVLYSILFDRDGSVVQIDCLLIFATRIVLVEVKNFRGEFTLTDQQFRSVRSGREYQNPLHQVNRAEINLCHIFSRTDYVLPVHAYVVFVNDGFTLYTKPNKKIILPTQLDGFFKHLNKGNGKLTKEHFALADQLRALHITDNPFEKMPKYEWRELRKGIFCGGCGGSMRRSRYHMECSPCDLKETLVVSIIRHTKAFALLFPHEKITTTKIWGFMGRRISKRTVRLYLASEFEQRGSGKAAHYHIW